MRLWVSSYLTGTASSISVSFIARFGPNKGERQMRVTATKRYGPQEAERI